MSAARGSGLQLRTSRFHDSSTARTARRSRPVRDWPRAPLAARRCSLKRSAVMGAASRSFVETAGLRLGRLAWKWCATCFLTKPTIAGRCVCSRISSDFRCRTRWRTGSGIGKSCGKSAGRLAAPATILKESLKGTARPGLGCFAQRHFFLVGPELRRKIVPPSRASDFLRARNEIILPDHVLLEILSDQRIVFPAESGEFQRVADRQRLDEFHHGAGSPLCKGSVVLGAERRGQHRRAIKYNVTNPGTQTLANNGGIAPLRWRRGAWRRWRHVTGDQCEHAADKQFWWPR